MLWKSMKYHTLKQPISHNKMAAFQELHDKITSQLAWAYKTKDLQQIWDYIWISYLSNTLALSISLSLCREIRASLSPLISTTDFNRPTPLKEKHVWISEHNRHVGIQWILICLCFRKSSGKKGRKFIREKIEKGTSPAAWFPARVPRGAEKQLAL